MNRMQASIVSIQPGMIIYVLPKIAEILHINVQVTDSVRMACVFAKNNMSPVMAIESIHLRIILIVAQKEIV
jgi:hypothetical protein